MVFITVQTTETIIQIISNVGQIQIIKIIFDRNKIFILKKIWILSSENNFVDQFDFIYCINIYKIYLV